MCIISAFPKGTEKSNEYTKEFIKNGFDCNQDGSGYMFKRSGEKTITINKGFFNVTDLINAISNENLQSEDELVVHHRISTAGKTSKENCHPFVASKSHNEVASLNITTNKPCVTHNGHFSSISKFQDLDRDFSDTYAFVRYIFSNTEVQRMFFEKDDLFKILTDDIIKSSKLAVLSKDNDMVLYGTFTEDKGYYHSNSTYCARKKFVYDNYEDYGYGAYGTYGTYYQPHDSKSRGGYGKQLGRKDWSEGYNKSIIPVISFPKNKTFDSLKLDNDSIIINSSNCHHFKFIKKGTINLNNISIATLEYGSMKEFDEKCETNVMTFRKDSVSGLQFEAIKTLDIIEKYYYYPTSTHLKQYQDYIDLTKEVQDTGKQTLKKLNYLLNKYEKVDEFSIIKYSRTNKFYQKGTLIMFKKLLEKELNFQSAKVISLSNATQEDQKQANLLCSLEIN